MAPCTMHTSVCVCSCTLRVFLFSTIRENMFCIICKLFLSVAGVLAYLQPQWKQEEITFLESIRQGKILTTFSSGAAGHTLRLKCFAEGA